MNLKRPLMIAGLTAVLATTASACGDDDNAATATTDSTNVETLATSPDSTTPTTDTTEAEGTVPETTGPPASASGDCPEEPTEESADELLIGLTEAEATEAAEACGWILRIGRVDGEDRPLTLDFRPNRVTVEITDGGHRHHRHRLRTPGATNSA
jgi:sugar/nucleoside kinase (ribokinase family)